MCLDPYYCAVVVCPRWSGHSLVFRHHWVINIISRHGCDQSLWLEEPLDVYHTCLRPKQQAGSTDEHQSDAFSLRLSLSLCHPPSLHPQVFFFFFFFFFFFSSITWSSSVTHVDAGFTLWLGWTKKKNGTCVGCQSMEVISIRHRDFCFQTVASKGEELRKDAMMQRFLTRKILHQARRERMTTSNSAL